MPARRQRRPLAKIDQGHRPRNVGPGNSLADSGRSDPPTSSRISPPVAAGSPQSQPQS